MRTGMRRAALQAAKASGIGKEHSRGARAVGADERMEDMRTATRSSASPKETTVDTQPAASEPASAVAVAEISDPRDPVFEHEEIARLAYSYWEAR